MSDKKKKAQTFDPYAQTLMKPFDSQLRWLVQSAGDHEIWYLIDLAANNYVGECSCPDFQYRKAPAAEHVKIPNDALRCKHLRAAREKLLDSLLKAMKEKEVGGED